MPNLSLTDVKNYFRDQRVLIVGNSVEMFNHRKGDFIDSFDKVVRLGNGIRVKGKSEVLGTKCDVWSSGDFRMKEYFEYHTEDQTELVELILFNNNRLRIERPALRSWVDKIPQEKIHQMFTDQEIIEKNKKWKYHGWSNNNDERTARLSGGIIAIMFMIEKVQTQKSLDIIGFDFFKKSTTDVRRGDQVKHHSWHRPIRDVIWENDRYSWDHDHKNEKQYALRAQEDGLLKWHMLSDLQEEVINDPMFTNW